MPAQDYSVGRDVSLVIFTNQGVIGTSLLTSFDARPIMADIKVIGIDGVMHPAYLPEGHEGSFEVARTDSGLDDYFAALEENYYEGADLPQGTITETIQERDGSVSQYRYEKVALKLADAGSYKGNAEVRQKIDFMASRKKKVL